MTRSWSISRRLQCGALVVLLVFLFFAALALEQRYAEHLRASHFARLQSEVYLLMAAAELDGQGRLTLPATLAEPLFTLPDSGLYATISTSAGDVLWQSPSTSGRPLPADAPPQTGAWLLARAAVANQSYHRAAMQVRWAIGGQTRTLMFAVNEDDGPFRAQLAQFRESLWLWLGGATLVLLIAQGILLRWGLTPLRRAEHEIDLIEAGRQDRLTGNYPIELHALTERFNRLLGQEYSRQQRYRDALGDLAHSLKTPLAVLKNSAGAGDYEARVNEQLERMNHIVQHQLARAAARGGVALAPPLPLRPVLERTVAALEKVYAERALGFDIQCLPEVAWPLDEGDAFELCGNLLDNAAKWARSHVVIQVVQNRDGLQIRVLDDGPGFACDYAAIERGVRLDEQVPGQGIGLSVVADIVAAYGGTLAIQRSELGGAAVVLSFS